MHTVSTTDAAKSARVTALIALALLAVLAAYQIWDVRAAFTDFEGWWGHFLPEYSGDDYVAVVDAASKHTDWESRYRAITLGMAIQRGTDDIETLVRPVGFWRLWSDQVITIESLEYAGIKEDYFYSMTSQAKHIEKVYDPRLPDATIQQWRDNGWVTEYSWSCANVNDGTDDPTIVMHTDKDRRWVYAVPAHLSPINTDNVGDTP